MEDANNILLRCCIKNVDAGISLSFECVRVVQSNLTALYLFFLFLFLFVMYVYILCKEGREFTKQLLRVRTRIYFQSVYYPVFIPFS